MTSSCARQPEYRDVIPMFGMVNEALLSTIGKDQLTTLCVVPLFVQLRA